MNPNPNPNSGPTNGTGRSAPRVPLFVGVGRLVEFIWGRRQSGTVGALGARESVIRQRK